MDRTMSEAQPLRLRSSRGFTLLEAMISIAILTVGLVALLSAFTMALASTQNVQLDAIARQKATEALESIFTARQTDQISFSQIANTSAVPPGIFNAGWTQLTSAGPDGLDGTADDTPPGIIMVPGSDGTMATQVAVNLANFQRQIVITPDPSIGNLKQITVSVQYPTPQGFTRTYSVQALISAYR